MLNLNCLEICRAACCRNSALPLTQIEAEMFGEAGADIVETKMKPPNPDEKVYKVYGDCPFLDENKCSLHGTEKQPRVCRMAPVGGGYCQGQRFKFPDNVIIQVESGSGRW